MCTHLYNFLHHGIWDIFKPNTCVCGEGIGGNGEIFSKFDNVMSVQLHLSGIVK